MNYTEEHIEYLREIVPGRPYAECQKMFNEKFGCEISRESVRRAAHRNGIFNGHTGRFEKGRVSPNKGKKMSPEMYERVKHTFFKPGFNHCNRRKIGSERITTEGYVEVKVADPNKWRMKHVIEWEKVNGPVPKGMAVIFRDGNRQNTDIENLVLISKAELLIMNKFRLRSNEAEITDAGVILSKLILKTSERKRNK